MRATTRITWLLLSLSFLFQIVCSSGGNLSATSVTKNAVTTMPAPPVVSSNGSPSGTVPRSTATIGSKPTTAPPTGDAGKKNEPTQTSTPAKPTTTVTTPAVTVATTSKPTVKPAPTGADKPTTPPMGTSAAAGTAASVVNGVTSAAAVTPSQTKTMKTAITDDSNTVLTVSPNTATVKTPETFAPSKASGTKAPVKLPGDTASVGTTKIPKVSTRAPTTGQQSKAHTTFASQTSQADSNGGTKKTTVTVGSLDQTTSRAPQPAGNTGTTSKPSTPTKAGLPTAETLSSKAETTAQQTTPTPTSSPTTTPAPRPTTTPAPRPTTTPAPRSTTSFTSTTTTIMMTMTSDSQPKSFLYSLNNGHEKEEEKELAKVCKRLMVNLNDGNCTLIWQRRNDKVHFDCVKINGKVKTSLATQYYEEITKKPTDNKTLIAILASCGALLIMIVILAVCASHHRKPYSENQQHLTEELHTVENGYHDNPTLEVMEVQPEMQEKKMVLNGEFNDSWIVPIDNLLKEDMPDEEDTHL